MPKIVAMRIQPYLGRAGRVGRKANPHRPGPRVQHLRKSPANEIPCLVDCLTCCFCRTHKSLLSPPKGSPNSPLKKGTVPPGNIVLPREHLSLERDSPLFQQAARVLDLSGPT